MIDISRGFKYLSKAENDLTEAKVLLDAGHSEGTCNRAYYALFDCILALLHTTNGPIPKTHTGAHTEFRKQFILSGLFTKTDSDTITELFNLRQGGDYELDFDLSQEDAQDAVNKASEFVTSVRNYLTTTFPNHQS